MDFFCNINRSLKTKILSVKSADGKILNFFLNVNYLYKLDCYGEENNH